MDAFEILVVILSVALAILLTVTIVFMVLVTKLVSKLRQIASKAEEIVDDVESVSSFFKRTTGPVAVTSFISNIVDTVTNFKKGKK